MQTSFEKYDPNVHLIRDILAPSKPKMGAEIGVGAGRYSRLLLDSLPSLELLVGVDRIRLKRFDASLLADGRYKHIVAHSVKAAKKASIAFDFIYVDAAHDYESVKADLWAWWPNLKKEVGIFCGDDYMEDENQPWGICQVKRAVDEFAEAQKMKVHVLNGGRPWAPGPSWVLLPD